MKIQKLLYRIIFYILIGILFLGFIILYAGIGGRNREGNLNFVLIGLLLLLPFGIWYIVENLKENNRNKLEKEENKRLLKSGDRILIDLDQVEIKSNNWQQEVERGSGYRKSLEKININYNLIELEVSYKDKTINYRLHINMELTKLKMYFAIQGKTYLYVDPQDFTNNYLDLSFMDKE